MGGQHPSGAEEITGQRRADELSPARPEAATATRREANAGRIRSVDAFRAVAIFAVILIHTFPFKPTSSVGNTLDLATAINEGARFAVPFFFVISGYFWAAKVESTRDIDATSASMAKRIAFIFVAWSLIYLLPWNIYDALAVGPLGPAKAFYWSIVTVVRNPVRTAIQGTQIHLWFLVGLLFSLGISWFLLRLRLAYLLVAVAVALYAVGLAGRAYSDSPFGFHVDFNFRHGPFLALIFFATGCALQRRRPDDSWFPIGLSIAAFGALLHFSELLLLNRWWGTNLIQDYVVGTYFLGTGVAIMALSDSRFLAFSGAASIGSSVLGIYVSHFIFVDLLRPVDRELSGDWAWAVSYPVIVFVLAYALTSALSRFPSTRKLVA